jgi:PAS domain S-box-containing protein
LAWCICSREPIGPPHRVMSAPARSDGCYAPIPGPSATRWPNEDAHHYGDDPAADRRHRAHPVSPLATLTPALVVLGRLPVPVLAIDREGTIIFANEPFTRMLGHTTETVTAMKFDQIFSSMAATPSPVSAVHAHAEQIVTLRHADGFTVRAKMSKSALLRGDDPVTLTTFQDLTEQLWTEGS